MAKRNVTFSNPILNNEIGILSESEESLVFKTTLLPQSGQTQKHYHTKITEVFKVISGELQVFINNKPFLLKENETRQISPFTKHQFYNPTNKTVVFKVTVNTPGKLREGLQIMYGLAEDGKVYKNGLPKNILLMAIALQKMDTYVPNIPRGVQNLGITVLAFLGKTLGLEQKHLRKYCT